MPLISIMSSIRARVQIPNAHRAGATWAVVPLKSVERAKSRLATVLGPLTRAQLFFTMAARVIGALRAARGIDAVAVVTASTEVAVFAAQRGAIPLLQSADLDMSRALSAALIALRRASPMRVLMLPGDLPLICPAAIERMLAADGGQRGVVIAADRRRAGTNALLCRPAEAIEPCFGPHSLARHVAAAAAAGARVRVLDIPELALDLDDAEDLQVLRRMHDPRTLRAPEHRGTLLA